jgi:hypothetical protein
MIPKFKGDDADQADQADQDADVPHDSGIVYFTFLMFGVGSLLPWNAVLNTFDYFCYEMPGKNVYGIYPFAVNFLVTVAQVVYVMLGGRVSYSFKLITGFLGCAVIMVALPFLARLNADTNFWAVFVALVLFGWFSG